MLTIKAVPVFNDNYIWLLQQDRSLWVVDPGRADDIIALCVNEGLKLEGILVTHHHNDHIGGIAKLLEHYPNLSVIGPQSDFIPCINRVVRDADTVKLWGLSFSVLEIPGHTLDHIAYYCDDDTLKQPILFCGDTLFAGGCGRIFEGSAAQMYHSLQRLKALKDNTEVYCTHEYTLANLMFASEVNPSNTALQQRVDQVRLLRQDGTITLPSTLALEKSTNPFLRCDDDEIINAALSQGSHDISPEKVFATIRQWKDNF